MVAGLIFGGSQGFWGTLGHLHCFWGGLWGGWAGFWGQLGAFGG